MCGSKVERSRDRPEQRGKVELCCVVLAAKCGVARCTLPADEKTSTIFFIFRGTFHDNKQQSVCLLGMTLFFGDRQRKRFHK